MSSASVFPEAASSEADGETCPEATPSGEALLSAPWGVSALTGGELWLGRRTAGTREPVAMQVATPVFLERRDSVCLELSEPECR